MTLHVRLSISGSSVIAPKVVQGTGQLYNIVVVAGFTIAKHVFHYSATLDARNDMLHNDANSRDQFILLFFLAGEFSATRFLLRLMNIHTYSIFYVY
jgi:hypothetical protein